MALVETRTERLPIPFVGGAYESSSLPVSAQEAVNVYPEIGQQASNPLSLRGAPGGIVFSDLGAPIRGLDRAFGVVYAVAGNTVYKILSTGEALEMGKVVDDGLPACLNENIFDVFVLSGGNGYSVSQSNDFAGVSVPDSSVCMFIDGYILVVEKNSGRFHWSAIDDLGAFVEFATAEGSPDDLVSGIVDHREIFLFGEESTEIWYNDGTSPFVRTPGGFIERGCGATHSPAKVDNTVFWLGDDLAIYRLSENRPTKVSNHGIDHLISQVNNPELGVGMAYQDNGHAFYQLTFPGELTVTYDAATGLPHTRKQFGMNDAGYRHHARAFGKHLVGGKDGKIYTLDDDVYTFGGELQRSRAVGPLRGPRFFSITQLTVLMETGANSRPIDPAKVFLEISTDAGKTFDSRIQASAGALGQYTTEINFGSLGGFYDNECVLRLSMTDDAKFALIDAYADIY